MLSTHAKLMSKAKVAKAVTHKAQDTAKEEAVIKTDPGLSAAQDKEWKALQSCASTGKVAAKQPVPVKTHAATMLSTHAKLMSKAKVAKAVTHKAQDTAKEEAVIKT